MFYRRMVLLLILTIFITLSSAMSLSHARFDESTRSVVPSLPLGEWTMEPDVSEELIEAFLWYYDVDDIEELYDDPEFLELLEYVSDPVQGGRPPDGYSLDNVLLGAYYYTFTGGGERSQQYRAKGFLRMIDRAKDDQGNPVHAIVPPLPSDPPPYEGYNIFTAFDVQNTQTNNPRSLRFEGKSTIESNEAFVNLEAFSFYASRGLAAPGETLAPDRKFFVEIREAGSSGDWLLIGEETLVDPPAGSEAFAFPFYYYEIPENLQGAPIHLRIRFEGGLADQGGGLRSRMVIDRMVYYFDE